MENGYTRTEYGLRIDCAKNGCDQPHADNGEVLLIQVKDRGVRTTAGGHAATAVERVVTVSAWADSR